MNKPLGTREGEGKPSRWSSSGPKCPVCISPLKKRNNAEGKYYECPRHGFVRDVATPGNYNTAIGN